MSVPVLEEADLIDIIALGGIREVSACANRILDRYDVKGRLFSEAEVRSVERQQAVFVGRACLIFDLSKSISYNVECVFARDDPFSLNVTAREMVLRHLVGAMLELALPSGLVIHHSSSEADQAEGRAGDFVIGDVAIHATTHPSEALIRKCSANINAGLRPLIVTVPAQTAVADGLADSAEILDKLEVLDIEQFLAANLHERSFFQTQNRSAKTKELLEHYNRLIDAHETDPSLKIEIAGQ